MKQVKRLAQAILLRRLKGFAILVVITGCLLSISPVKAVNEFTQAAPGHLEDAAAVPSAATIVVNGGGQTALANAIKKARPGDTILVKAGNYDDNDPLESLEISVSGTANAPITLLGENRPSLGTIEFKDANFVIIDGFEIAHQTSSSFFLGLKVKNSKNITIRNMLIHHLTGSAISTSGDSSDIVIEDSKIYEIVPRQTDDDAHCLINSTARNITFRNNECYGFIGDGYQAWRVDDTQLYDRGTTLIEGNKIYNTKGACSENAVDLKGETGTVIVRGNILHGFQPLTGIGCQLEASGDPAGTAILAHDGSNGALIVEGNEFYDMYAGIDGNQMNTIIRNNLFHDFKEGLVTWSTHLRLGVILANQKTKVYHNTFVNTPFIFNENSEGGQQTINNLFNNVSGNNLEGTITGDYQKNSWFKVHPSQHIAGPGDLVNDPRLDLDPNNNLPNYSLLSESPLINQGKSGLDIATDFTGAPDIRLLNSPPDVGAFEFTGNVLPPTPTATLEPSPSPTPGATPSPTATPQPVPSETPDPQPTPEPITLAFNGPDEVSPGQSFDVSVEAHGVTDPGLYGVQLEINYEPSRFSVSNLQVNPDLTIVILNSIDDASGKIRVAAARQGNVPGLTGDVPLLSFTLTAAETAGNAILTIVNQKVGNAQAVVLATTTESYSISIMGTSTPEPTETPTPPTETPIPNPTETPLPTDTPIPGPTDTPTPGPTETPEPQPSDTPTPGPTETPEPQPSDTPTPGPTETPVPTATVEPGLATVMGQIILTGQVNNDWSGARATVDEGELSATTDATGHFSLVNVIAGLHNSITADAAGYLPAVCTAPSITAPETVLAKITLLSGDVNDDGQINITDATTIGVYFGQSGVGLAADLNRDEVVDILDLILVTINFGQGPQVWSCLE